MTSQSPVGAADPVIAQLFSPAGQRDPRPLYDQLLRIGPVLRGSDGKYYLVGHAACDVALRSPAFGSAARVEALRADWRDHSTFTIVADGLTMVDPPDHTRLHRLVTGAFTARRVQAMQHSIGVLVDGLLDRLAERGSGGGSVDFMTEVGSPLPVAVISTMLGLPVEDFDIMGPLARSWIAGLGMASMVSDETLKAADDAADRMWALLSDAAATRRRNPGDDLLSALIDVRDRGTGFSENELVTMIFNLYVAGFLTTAYALGNALVAFESFPDQADLLRASPELAACAVEELLRYDAPIQFVPRLMRQEVTIEGECIPAGTAALIMLGAANRDPRVFHLPDRLDLRRDPNPHLAFGGGGIHHCLGAMLAKAELRQLLPSLLRRFPDLRLDADRRSPPNVAVRGYDYLPVHLGHRDQPAAPDGGGCAAESARTGPHESTVVTAPAT